MLSFFKRCKEKKFFWCMDLKIMELFGSKLKDVEQLVLLIILGSNEIPGIHDYTLNRKCHFKIKNLSSNNKN
jgi:hypothetical protein